MAFKGLEPIQYGGREVWPLVEGGKGVSATNHLSSGAWAAAGGIGTVSAVNADSYDAEGKIVPQVYDQLTRKERDRVFASLDRDGSGVVTFGEFHPWFKAVRENTKKFVLHGKQQHWEVSGP